MTTKLVITKAGRPITPGIAVGIEDFGELASASQLAISNFNADSETADRLLDQAEIADQFADVASNIDHASETDLAMAEIAARMATLTTDIAATAPVAGIESWHNQKIGIEGFREIATEIVNWIKELVAGIWAGMVKLWADYTDMCASIKRRAQVAIERAADKRNSTINRTTTVPLGLTGKYLCINGFTPKDVGGIISHLNKQHQIAEAVYGNVVGTLINTGKSLVKVFTDVNTQETDLGPILIKMNAAFIKEIAGLERSFPEHVDSDTRFPQGASVASLPGCIGNTTMFYMRSAANQSADGDLDLVELAKANRNTALKLLAYTGEVIETPRDSKVPEFSAADTTRLANLCLDLVARVDQYRARELVKIDTVNDEFNAAITQAASRLSGADESQSRYWKSIATYFATYSRLNSSGVLSYTLQLLRACSAAMSVCEKNLDGLN